MSLPAIIALALGVALVLASLGRPGPRPPGGSALAILLLLSGCGHLNTAIVTANGARDVAEVSAPVIESQCTDRYRVANRSEVPEIDRACVPVSAAYAAFQIAWASLSAEILSAQAGHLDAARLQTAIDNVVIASRALSVAIERVK